MGCGFSRFSRAHDRHEDIEPDTLMPLSVPFSLHRENIDNRLKREERREREREYLSPSVNDVRREGVSTVRRRRANRFQSITVGSIGSLNSVLYFMR